MKPKGCSPSFQTALELILKAVEDRLCAEAYRGRGPVDYEARAKLGFDSGYAIMEDALALA